MSSQGLRPTEAVPIPTQPDVLDRAGLDALVRALRADGRACVAPTVKDDAIVLAEIEGADQLPSGWTDEQSPGRYRLRKRDDEALFAHALGPHSWRRWLFPPEERLWTLKRAGAGFLRWDDPPAPRKLAFLGVRACELRALHLQDLVFGGGASGGAFFEPRYTARRAEVLLVAVGCTAPGGTCFCASVGAGPAPGGGHDLLLTPLPGAPQRLLAEAGSVRGRELLAALPRRPAAEAEVGEARRAVADAAARMGRTLRPDARALLADNPESPRWAEVGARCQSCASCTLVCPTCFCSSVQDTTNLGGERAERWRRWDSCFNPGFSYLHGGGEVRPTTRARYRQWLTHKLSTWVDQFGASGCVGCGRCITWCPVGIDLTAEVAALAAAASTPGGAGP